MERFTQQLRWLLASLMLTLGMSTWGADETITFSGTNGVAMGTITQGDLTITWDKGSNNNAPKWYNTGSAVRCYGGNSITVTSSGSNIAEITVTFGSSDGSNEITTDVGTWTSPTWTGDASSVKFTIGGTSGNRRIQKLEVTYTAAASDAPSFTSDNVDIDYDATSGSIAYTVNNPVTGGSVSASTTADWLTLGSATSSPVSFTCTANSEAAERTATVTLTYAYGSETATKDVTITQAGNPNVVNNISDITANGTYTVKGTIVAKSQRGFIVGDGTGYVYYYNSSYDQNAYNVGDKVKLSGSVVTYGGVFEFNNSTTIETATESNYVEENPTILSGADMDSRVASTTPTQLSSYVQYQGTLSVSGSYYNITDIDGATTAQGSISYPINTDFTSLDGAKVTVKGFFVGVSNSKYYNTLIGSIEAVAGFVAAPEFSVAEGEYNAAQNVEITCATTGASIYYTLDGTDPTTSSALYDGTPLTISTTTTLKAIASDGTNVSEITSATYTIDTRTPTTMYFAQDYATIVAPGTEFTITVGETVPEIVGYVKIGDYEAYLPFTTPLSYRVDNSELATVDATTGAVTLVDGATGTLKVTATFEGDSERKGCEGYYTLKVKAATPTTGDLFNETFADFDSTGGRDDSYSGSVGAGSTTNTDEKDWIFTKCGGASSSLKFGTSSANGVFTTRSIALTGDGTLTFSAAGWSSGTNTLAVTATDGTLSGDTEVTLTNGEWTDYTVNITGATGDLVLTFTGKRGFIDDIKVVSATPDERTATTTSFNAPTESYEVTLGEAFTAPTATLDPAAAGSLIYESSDPTVATVNANTGAVEIIAAGTTTITAKFEGNNNYKPSQASYTITVTDPNAKGTETNPYTVAEAIAYIETLGTSTSPSEVYVSGIISQVDSYNSTYKSITYWISDDGETTTQMEVYSGKGLEGADFSAAEDLQKGDIVTIFGFVKKYSGTPEFDKNNKLVSFERPAVAVEAPVFSVDGGTYTEDKTVEITCATTGASIYYTLDGTEPTTASTPYTAALTISETTTLKAIASDGTNTSTITEATYTINKPTPTTTEAFVLVEDGTITEGDYLIVYDGGAMNTTVEGNRLKFAEVSPDYNNIISTNNASIIWHIAKSGSYYTIYNAAANAYAAGTEVKNNAQMLADGTSDKALWTVEATAGETTFDFTNKANEAKGVNATLRRNGNFGFACYSTLTGDPLSLYKKVSTVSIDLIAAQDNYKTMVAPYDMVVPTISDGMKAYIVTLNSEQTEANLEQIVNIPAGTPIILHANSAGSYELEKAGTDFTADDVSKNVLLVSNGEIEGDGTIFVLNKVNNVVGFYRLNDSMPLATGKCYLKIEKSTDVKFIGFNFDDATGIETVESTNDNLQGTIYNLAGQRVATPAHGLYIVNGKKVFIK